eukprot:gene55490-74084_t
MFALGTAISDYAGTAILSAVAGLAGVAGAGRDRAGWRCMTMSETSIKASSRILEICVDDAEGLAAAIKGGADRIELCSSLGSGGLTPSFGFMQLAARAPIPVNALIRPRVGDFVFGDEDIDIMIADIEAARAAGLAGVVIGAAQASGTLDRPVLERLVEASR